MESERTIEELQALADQLEVLEKSQNGGQGIEYVRWLVDDLRRGDLAKARANYRNQSDKYGNYPEVLNLLKASGIA